MADDHSNKHLVHWDPAVIRWHHQQGDLYPQDLVRRSIVNRALKSHGADGKPRNFYFLKNGSHRALEDFEVDEFFSESRCDACRRALAAERTLSAAS